MNLGTLLLILAIYFFAIRPLIRYLARGLKPDLRSNPEDAKTVLRAIFIVAAKVAHADGKETPKEREMIVKIVRETLGQPNISSENIIKEFRKYSKHKWTHADAQALSMSYRQIVFQCALHVAVSDHRVTSEELKVLRHIGQTLEIPDRVVEQILGQLGAASGQQRTHQGESMSAKDFAYKVLDLQPGASQAEIKKRYRKLAMENHPDSAPESEKAAATERFKEIGDAYRILKSDLEH